MTQIELGWGSGPSARYEQLAEPFRPLFQKIGRQRHIAPERRHHAGADPAIHIVRGAVRHRPVVDDHGRRGRAVLDQAAIADDVVVERQVQIGMDRGALHLERRPQLHAEAADQGLGGLRADGQRQRGIDLQCR